MSASLLELKISIVLLFVYEKLNWPGMMTQKIQCHNLIYKLNKSVEWAKRSCPVRGIGSMFILSEKASLVARTRQEKYNRKEIKERIKERHK